MTADAFSTPLALLCSDCHAKCVELTTVRLSWNLATSSASFTWAGIGGGKISRSGDDLWIVEGQQVEEQDQQYGIAVDRWARKLGYIGLDPFTRLDYSWRSLDDNTSDMYGSDEIAA